jgi:hypothetical protein
MGEFSHLLVWKIDRISRNLLDFVAMYDEIKSLGVIFVSKNEQFDTSTAMGEAMLKIILVFAELERNMTSERVTAVMLSRASQGQWNGGKIPMGYALNSETGEFTIIEAEAKIIITLFELYASGKSLLAIARLMNEKGIKAKSGAVWTPTTIWIILTNPFYYGALRYNYRNEQKGPREWFFKPEKEWIITEDHHQAIISKSLFDECQKILDRRNSKKRETPKTYERKNIHIFAGLLKCASCGSSMAATIDRPRADGSRPSVYLCSRRRRFNDCKNKYISDMTIGPFAFNYISNLIRAERSFGRSTSIDVFRKKLLRGQAMESVSGIQQDGLTELYDLIRGQKYGYQPYVPHGTTEEAKENDLDARERLVEEKKKHERALSRLKALYLYSEDALPEKDYLIERARLMEAIAGIDRRLAEDSQPEDDSQFLMSDELMPAAYYYDFVQQLLDRREVDFQALVKDSDPRILKDFLNSVVQNFCILDGKILSIRFKNGLEQVFTYNDRE